MVEEGAAYGAALLGGVAGGTWPDTAAAVAACVRVRGEVEPEPAWIAPYAEGRERFRALYPALRGVTELTCAAGERGRAARRGRLAPRDRRARAARRRRGRRRLARASARCAPRERVERGRTGTARAGGERAQRGRGAA